LPGNFKFDKEVKIMKKLYWRCINNKGDLVLENLEEFDNILYEELVDNLRIATQGLHPDPESLIIFLKEWGNSIKQGKSEIFPFSYYSRLLRWSITDAWHITSEPIDTTRELWKFLFGSPIPTFYQYNRYEREYEVNVEQWKEWYEMIKNQLPIIQQAEHRAIRLRDYMS
jgi:hypothetical protein